MGHATKEQKLCCRAVLMPCGPIAFSRQERCRTKQVFEENKDHRLLDCC